MGKLEPAPRANHSTGMVRKLMGTAEQMTRERLFNPPILYFTPTSSLLVTQPKSVGSNGLKSKKI